MDIFSLLRVKIIWDEANEQIQQSDYKGYEYIFY